MIKLYDGLNIIVSLLKLKSFNYTLSSLISLSYF